MATKIICLASDCIFWEDRKCTSTEIIYDVEEGCLTYEVLDDLVDLGEDEEEWEDDELIDDEDEDEELAWDDDEDEDLFLDEDIDTDDDDDFNKSKGPSKSSPFHFQQPTSKPFRYIPLNTPPTSSKSAGRFRYTSLNTPPTSSKSTGSWLPPHKPIYLDKVENPFNM